MSGTRSYRFFVSYSHVDQSLRDPLISAIKRRGPIFQCFDDKYDLVPGDLIPKKLRDAIHKSDYYILIATESSLSSDWVQAELKTAEMSASTKLFIYVPPGVKLNIPMDYAFTKVMRSWDEVEKLLDELHRSGSQSLHEIKLKRNVQAAMERTVHPNGIVYLRFCTTSGQDLFKIDLLDEWNLEKHAGTSLNYFFSSRVGLLPNDQRAKYSELFNMLIDNMNLINNPRCSSPNLDTASRLLSEIQQGRIVRCVADVERGALYVYEVAMGFYLCGATVWQRSVYDCDTQMKVLCDEMKGIFG